MAFRLHDISKSGAVFTDFDVILFIYFEKLFLSLMNSVYKKLHGKHAQVHSLYILMLLSIPSIPILLGHLSSRDPPSPPPSPQWSVSHQLFVCGWGICHC